METKPLATNGRPGVGVPDTTPQNYDTMTGEDFSGFKYADQITGAPCVKQQPYGEDFSDLKYVNVEAVTPPNEERVKASGAKRRKLVRGFLVLATLALVVIGLFFWIGDGRKKIDLSVRDRNAQTGQGAPQKIDDVTAQAIAEVRGGASASPTPAPSAASSAETAVAQDATPVTIPLGATVAAVESAPAPNVSGVSSIGATAKSPEINSGRNTERSIRAAPVPKPDASSPRQPAAAPDAAGVLRAAPAAEKTVTLPPFGAMLPVRTLGAIFTLRQSLARLELTRDVRGQGWMLKKGTILVGQQQGGEFDRAYVSLMGFIDTGSGKFVKLGGDVLGADGAPGIRGKRRRISSRWARILSRAADAGIALGQAALSRGGTIVNVQGAVSPELQGLTQSAMDRREFVEAPAGSTAFVLVTDLPKEVRGSEAQPVNDNGGGQSLRDEELANLLTDGSPEQIRAALPRMTPELRRIAEAVLRESTN
jgi:hypothetical protein